MLWYPEKQYGDFSLTFEWREARTDGGHSNGGVFARFPDPRTPADQRGSWGACNTGSATSQPAWVAIFCGHEFQIYDGPTGEVQKTGSVYNFQPLDLDAGPAVAARRVEHLRAARGRPDVLDPAQRQGHQPVRQRGRQGVLARRRPADAGAPLRRGLHRPPEPQRPGRPAVPQHPGRPSSSPPRASSRWPARAITSSSSARRTSRATWRRPTRSTFTIDAPVPTFCATDPFDGTALDDARWDVLNPGRRADGRRRQARPGDGPGRPVPEHEHGAQRGAPGPARGQGLDDHDAAEHGRGRRQRRAGRPRALQVAGPAEPRATSTPRRRSSRPTPGPAASSSSGPTAARCPSRPARASCAAPAELPANADVSVRLRSDGHVVVAEYSRRRHDGLDRDRQAVRGVRRAEGGSVRGPRRDRRRRGRLRLRHARLRPRRDARRRQGVRRGAADRRVRRRGARRRDARVGLRRRHVRGRAGGPRRTRSRSRARTG